MLAAVAPVARADQIVTAEVTYTKVAVVGYVDGDLHLRLADGSTKPVPLVNATGLVIDTVSGLADFNQAEGHLAQGRLPEAATRYERALRSATGFWIPIIHHRLLQVYDGLGKFDRVVTFFIKVADESPAAAARLMPTSIPDKRSATTQRAVQRLAAEGRKAADAKRRVLMELLAYAVMLRAGHGGVEGRTRHVARTDIPLAIATAGVYAPKIAALDRLRNDGERDEVLVSVEAMAPRCPPEVLPGLLLLKGRTLLDDAADRQSLLRAGLAFMRVAIHFPGHELAPEALFWAAEVHERIERPGKAAQLLNECLAHDRTNEPLRGRARAERERLAGGAGD